MRKNIIPISVTFADPAGDKRFPLFKVPAGMGSVTVAGARVVTDTTLNVTDANARAISLQNGGTNGAGTTQLAVSGGVDTVGVDAVWTLTVDATAGNFIIGDGTETHVCAFNISAANLQTELRTWASMGTNTATVTGGPGDDGGTTPYVITIDTHDATAELDVALTAVDDTEGTPLSGGGATVEIDDTTTGVAPSDAFDWTAETPRELSITHPAGQLAEG